MLEMVCLASAEIVSQSLSMTLVRLAKTSLRKPHLRISFQICSIGFISGVYGGMWNSTIFSGISSVPDLCHAAPSQHSRMISSGYSLDSPMQKHIHTHRIAPEQHQKATISCPGVHSSEGIVILPDMVTGHTWTDTILAPAMFRLVDPSKSCFILEHQADIFASVDNFQFFDP